MSSINIDVKNNTLLISGCGKTGSYISYLSCLNNLKNGSFYFDTLILIDYDVIEENNLPYLFNYKEEYIGYSKVLVLKDILYKKFPNINIITYNDNINELTINKTGDGLLVDCTDSTSELSIFDLKLSFDGNTGKVITNPSKSDGYNVNYRFTTIDIDVIEFSIAVVKKFIFNNRQHNRNTYLFLSNGESYEFNKTQRTDEKIL